MNYSEAIDLIRDLTELRTINRDSKKMIDSLERYIEERGYSVSRREDTIWCIAAGFDSNKKTVLLYTQLDNETNLDASTIKLLCSFFQLSLQSLSYNLIVSVSAEENSPQQNHFQNLLAELPKVDFAVLGDTTEMKIEAAGVELRRHVPLKIIVPCKAEQHYEAGTINLSECLDVYGKIISELKI